jgi:hypothetical protein
MNTRPCRASVSSCWGWWAPLLFAFATLLSACEQTPEGRVPVHRVTGQVTFKGKPLPGAVVSFHPVDDAKYGNDVPRPQGRTNEEGKFQLMTYAADDGAPAGSYVVGISSMPKPRTETGLFNNPKAPLPTDVLKGRYIDPKKSNLQAQVKEGENELPPFELK